MRKILILINKLGDEVKYFSSIILKNDVDILCLMNKENENTYESNWYLINKFIKKDIKLKNSHYDLNEINEILLNLKSNNYDAVYTYDLNFDNDSSKDDLIYCAYKIFKTIYSCTKNSYPQLFYKLTRSEFWLKKNYLLTNVNKELSDITAVETFKKHSKKEVENYYLKKYLAIDFEYKKSPYFIELQQLIIDLIKKYDLKKASMVGFNNSFFSKRVDLNNLKIVYKHDVNSDILIINNKENLCLNYKYLITINFEIDNMHLLESYVIKPVVEKMYLSNKKSNIDIYREKMVVNIYENINR